MPDLVFCPFKVYIVIDLKLYHITGKKIQDKSVLSHDLFDRITVIFQIDITDYRISALYFHTAK